MITPPPASGFRLLRYFTLASLAAFVLVTLPLMYLGRMGDEFFHQTLQEQSEFFVKVQNDFARQQNETARRDLMTIHEAGNITLTHLFANALWEKDFAPLIAKAQRIPVAHCRAIADLKDSLGNRIQPDAKKACYAGIGNSIRAFPEFGAINARVFDAMKKSTVFKIKVYDLRGITVYSSDHKQIGEDKLGNAGWQSAMAGKPASALTHRDKFSAFEGIVEDRDLIEIYVPATAPGSEKIVGVFEIYSDVTPFLEQISITSAQIQKANAENQAQLAQAVAASEDKADDYLNLLFAVVLGLLVLLYGALSLIVRNGQRIIDREQQERMQAETALAESEARFRSLSGMSSDFYWETDTEHRITLRTASDADAGESVFHQTSPLGLRRWEIPYVSPDKEAWEDHRAMLEVHLPFRDFEISRLANDGSVRHVSLSGDPVFDASGKFKGYRGVGTDITGRKAAEEEIRNLAFYDPLTQLPNRRLLMDRLHQALAGSDRSRRRGALLFIDLDHFKTLNDTLGHDKGDLLLQQVAQRLTACVRETDTVARLGGDEFVVMLEDLSGSAEEAAAQTRTIAEKILATFSQPYLLAGHPHHSSGSIGIAPFCGHDQTATVLLKHADIAMYQAKTGGRNALRFFEPGMAAAIAAAEPDAPALSVPAGPGKR